MTTTDSNLVTDTAIPTRSPGFSLEEIEGETLLYSPNQTKTVYLNQTATIIWQLCDGERSVQHIEAMLIEAFPDAGEAIPNDLKNCLKSLKDDGAIHLVALEAN